MNNDFKRIPYGICDFKQVRKENKYLRAASARACS